MDSWMEGPPPKTQYSQLFGRHLAPMRFPGSSCDALGWKSWFGYYGLGDHNENSNPATTSYSVQLGCISIAHNANNRMQTKYDGVHSMNDAKLMHIYNELATDMEIGSSVGPRLRANLTGIWLRLVTLLEISVHFHFYAMTNYPKISNDYQTNTLCSVSSSITMTWFLCLVWLIIMRMSMRFFTSA